MKLPEYIEQHLAVLGADPQAAGYVEAFEALERYARGGIGTVAGILGVLLLTTAGGVSPLGMWRWALVAVGVGLTMFAIFYSPLRRSERVRRALDAARDHVNRLNVERGRS